MRADPQGSGTSTIDSTDGSDEQNTGQPAMQVDETIVIRSTAAEEGSCREQSRAGLLELVKHEEDGLSGQTALKSR